MDTTAGQPWSQAEEQLAQMGSELDDLGSFLDFGEIGLDIPNVDSTQFADAMQHLSHPGTPFNEMGHAAPPPGTSTQDFGGLVGFDMSHDMSMHQHQYIIPTPNGIPYSTEAVYEPSMQQGYYPTQAPQYQYPPQSGFPPGLQIPPTPNSFDMHGEASIYLQQQQHHFDAQQRAIMDNRFALSKNDAIAFTPMVSPAGTPQFNMAPDLTMPGAYFSPLTSPMLHAQRAHSAQQLHQQLHGYYTTPNTAPSSNATSPTDPSLDIDMMGDNLILPESATTPTGRRLRGRRMTTPRSIAAGARVRQSPLQKAQKRKSGTLAQVMTSREEPVSEAQVSAMLPPGSAGLQAPTAFNVSSEDGSISPEPLSDSVMGPPPRPGSRLTKSPAMLAQQKDSQAETAGPAATPKSLLSRDGNPEPINGSSEDAPISTSDASFEDLHLPEAAAKRPSRRPSLTQIHTQMLPETSDEQTPRMSARKTPKLGPLSTPSSARPLASPSVMDSPMTASTPGGLLKDKKPETKGAKGNKKRGNVIAGGSVTVSPAILPRISPSIKPLLPEGCKCKLILQRDVFVV